ncbi:hypothetical protein LZ31DRAFT_561087 [Colletotrichum somersetense]|nr:hypothetical protein LZ31DRAFT_561087 [Colletotrichum somersetense]
MDLPLTGVSVSLLGVRNVAEGLPLQLSAGNISESTKNNIRPLNRLSTGMIGFASIAYISTLLRCSGILGLYMIESDNSAQ